ASLVTFNSTLQDGVIPGGGPGIVTGIDDLTINGDAVFAGEVSDLNDLHVTGATTISTASITTNGSQTYDGPVTLLASTTLTALNSATVAFSSTVEDGYAAGTDNLTLVAAVVFAGIVGGVDAGNPTALGSLEVDGTALIESGASSINTIGGQSYYGPVTIAI